MIRNSAQSLGMGSSSAVCEQESWGSQEMLSPQGATKKESLTMLPQTKLKAWKALGDLLVRLHVQRWKIWILLPADSVSIKKHKNYVLVQGELRVCMNELPLLPFLPIEVPALCYRATQGWSEPPRDGPPHPVHSSIC